MRSRGKEIKAQQEIHKHQSSSFPPPTFLRGRGLVVRRGPRTDAQTDDEIFLNLLKYANQKERKVATEWTCFQKQSLRRLRVIRFILRGRRLLQLDVLSAGPHGIPRKALQIYKESERIYKKSTKNHVHVIWIKTGLRLYTLYTYKKCNNCF